MNHEEEIKRIELRSIELYRIRQKLEESRIILSQDLNKLGIQINQVERELVELDGEMSMLNRMNQDGK